METPIPESRPLCMAASLTFVRRCEDTLYWTCDTCGAIIADDMRHPRPLRDLHPVPVVTWEHSREESMV
jgi:hypothetical protein